MEEDFISEFLRCFGGILDHNQKLKQLGVHALYLVDVLSRNRSVEKDHLEDLRKIAMMAVSCGEGVMSKLLPARRCKWWNRGYCKEQDKCLFNHQGEDCGDHLTTGFCTSQACKSSYLKRCRYWALKEGCHRGFNCQYLHFNKDNPK